MLGQWFLALQENLAKSPVSARIVPENETQYLVAEAREDE